jgi:hypothetical protein
VFEAVSKSATRKKLRIFRRVGRGDVDYRTGGKRGPPTLDFEIWGSASCIDLAGCQVSQTPRWWFRYPDVTRTATKAGNPLIRLIEHIVGSYLLSRMTVLMLADANF